MLNKILFFNLNAPYVIFSDRCLMHRPKSPSTGCLKLSMIITLDHFLLTLEAPSNTELPSYAFTHAVTKVEEECNHNPSHH
jgi:hypothetical protein